MLTLTVFRCIGLDLHATKRPSYWRIAAATLYGISSSLVVALYSWAQLWTLLLDNELVFATIVYSCMVQFFMLTTAVLSYMLVRELLTGNQFIASLEKHPRL